MITREPALPNGFGFFGALLSCLGGIGRASILTFQAILLFPVMLFRGRSRRELVSQMYQVGIKSLPLITVVGLFTGMILALQVGLELRRYNQEIYIGSAVMISLLREMGPFMTGIVLTACVGSSMAAQLGTMTVNEEIAALEMMAINPVRFLMAPRMAAMMFMTPILSFYTCILGVIGGGMVGATQLNVPWQQYIKNAMDFADNRDLYIGLFKALIFAAIITGVSCYEGFTTRKGAVGVGHATRRTVIVSILMILMTGYIITRMFYEL